MAQTETARNKTMCSVLLRIRKIAEWPTAKQWRQHAQRPAAYFVDGLLAAHQAFLQLLVVFVITQAQLIRLHGLFMLFHKELQMPLKNNRNRM